MFTRQAPSLFPAFAAGMDSASARQVVQAFANCNQSLTHRGNLSIQRPALNQNQGVLQLPGGANQYFTGTSGSDPTENLPPWALTEGSIFNSYYGLDARTENYYNATNLHLAYPEAGGDAYYSLEQVFDFGPVESNYASNWHTQLGDTNLFDFSTRQGDILNNYQGPTFQVEGDSHFDNSTHFTQEVTNQNVTRQTVDNSRIVNLEVGSPGSSADPALAGPQGPPGAAGAPGLAGPQGPPGAVFFVPGFGFPGPLLEREVLDARDWLPRARTVNIGPYLRGSNPRVNAIRTLKKTTVQIPTSATLDPETCDITLVMSDVEVVVDGEPEICPVQGLRQSNAVRVVTP